MSLHVAKKILAPGKGSEISHLVILYIGTLRARM